MNGTCALCGFKGKLEDSHFMPKAIYKVIRQSYPGISEDIVWVSGKDNSAAYTSKQAKKYLLCRCCEERFDKNGEKYVLALMARPNGFKLATKIKKLNEHSSIDDEVWYFPGNSISTNKFMYFAISIAWRSSTTEWGEIGLPPTSGKIRTETMSIFEEYLLGKIDKPKNTFVVVYVDNKAVDYPILGVPTVKNHNGYQHIVFNIPGIKFSIITGDSLADSVFNLFENNKENIYFVSKDLKSHPDFFFLKNYLKNTAIPRKRLANECRKKGV